MNILILGATGFIGKAIFHSLVPHHQIKAGSRSKIEGFANWVQVDFLKDNDWPTILQDIDLVINAIGIIEGDFDKVQTQGPAKLFEACAQKKIKVIQISAIGAEKKHPPTLFLQSKKKADDLLLQSELGKVIYPGIVIGKNGRSSRFFAEMAGFPLVAIPGEELQAMVHISQLTSLIKKIVDRFDDFPSQVFAVAEPETLPQLLSAIKGKKVPTIKLPKWIMTFFFTLFPRATFGLFNKDTSLLYQQLDVKDYKPIFAKVSPLLKAGSIKPSNYLVPTIALAAIVFIWIWSGISSIIDLDESYKLMAETGANHQLSTILIILGCVADIVLGLAVLHKRYRKKVLLLQVAFILTYTLILTVFAAHFWVHPFGVISKNIPLLALSFYLYRK